MKLAYTHPNIAVVVQVRELIAQAGIRCVIRNEYAAGAIGELAPINAWPEVWVHEDGDLLKAVAVVEKFQQAVKEPDWQCARCSNANPANFETCWHCGTERSFPGA